MPSSPRPDRLAALDRTSAIPAALLLLAAIGFGASRDLGAFLLALVVLPTLALVTVAWIGMALLAGGARATRVGLATAVALAALPAYPMAGAARDPVRFVGWELAHAPVDRLTRRDAVLAW